MITTAYTATTSEGNPYIWGKRAKKLAFHSFIHISTGPTTYDEFIHMFILGDIPA
jgi:hypothetical protein